MAREPRQLAEATAAAGEVAAKLAALRQHSHETSQSARPAAPTPANLAAFLAPSPSLQPPTLPQAPPPATPDVPLARPAAGAGGAASHRDKLHALADSFRRDLATQQLQAAPAVPTQTASPTRDTAAAAAAAAAAAVSASTPAAAASAYGARAAPPPAAHAARAEVEKAWDASELKWRARRSMASACAPPMQNENVDANQGLPLESEAAAAAGFQGGQAGSFPGGGAALGAAAAAQTRQAVGDAAVTDQLLWLQGRQQRSPLRAAPVATPAAWPHPAAPSAGQWPGATAQWPGGAGGGQPPAAAPSGICDSLARLRALMAAPPGATLARLPQYDAQPGADQLTSLGAAVGKTLGSEARQGTRFSR